MISIVICRDMQAGGGGGGGKMAYVRQKMKAEQEERTQARRSESR